MKKTKKNSVIKIVNIFTAYLFLFIVFTANCIAAKPVAISFKYYIVQNKGRHIMLSATSDDINFNNVEGASPDWGNRYASNRWGATSAISSWVIDTVPVHGVLYNGTTVIANGSIISGPDALYYKPSPGWTGDDSITYHVTDSHGTSDSVTVDLITASPSNYPLPIGVPALTFGINEEPPADPPAWPSNEVAGFYYFDNNDPNCSDSNTYGHPDQPRCNIGSSITVGADQKAVFAPGSHITTTRSFINFNLNGTPGHEAWLVGVDNTPNPPVFEMTDGTRSGKNIRLTGKNYRISGLEFIDAHLRQYGTAGDNTVVRYSVMHDYHANSGNVCSVGDKGGTNVLYFNVYAYNIGNVEPDLTVEHSEHDVHAFNLYDIHNLWILDTMTAVTAGDGVQLTNNNVTSDIWIGRFTSHTPMENCIDIKSFNKVVVSESNCWDVRTVTYSNSGGNAQNFYVNDEGVQQNFVYFLNNRSWDSNGDLYSSGNVGGAVYFIGNRGFFAPEANGLAYSNGGGSRFMHFNSFGDVNIGINVYNAGGASHRWITGNYFSNITDYAIKVMNYNAATLDYNMFSSDNNTYGLSSYSSPISATFQEYKDATGYGAHSEEGISANLTSPLKYNFNTQTPSELINVIQPDQISTLFPGVVAMQTDLGITPVDYLGTSRPQGSTWDIGAYEYVENQTIRADVDNNSTINTTDALLTLRNSLGLDMSSTDWFTSSTTGDVNCDNVSNSTDAMLILRHSLGLDMSGTGWCE